MGNKPISDIQANTSINCACFTKQPEKDIVTSQNMGEKLVVSANNKENVEYRYKKRSRRGHVYTKAKV